MSNRAGAQSRRTVCLYLGDGCVPGTIGWNDYSPAARAIESGVMKHRAQQYGRANPLANLAVCPVPIGTTNAGWVL